MEQVVKARNLRDVNFRFGYYFSLITAVVTLGTFTLAVMTPPLSGPFCAGSCFEYPFTGIEARFPRDYLWMYPSMLVSMLFVVLFICIHEYAAMSRKMFSRIGVSIAIISASILIPNYFVQVTVIQPSLLNGEKEGIALFSQYNAHGMFIALEEISYLLMNFSFFAIIPVFTGTSGLSKAIRITCITGFILSVLSLIFVSLKFGIMREYIFEVIIISRSEERRGGKEC